VFDACTKGAIGYTAGFPDLFRPKVVEKLYFYEVVAVAFAVNLYASIGLRSQGRRNVLGCFLICWW